MQEEQNFNEDGEDPSTSSGQAMNDDEIVDYNQYYSRPPLSKGQKIAVAVLAFFSFFIIVMWVMQFKKGISNPLDSSSNTDNSAISTNQTATPTEEETMAIQKTKDTDGDGLNDYDELYVYKTSPYLEDSDSDGFNDKVEIDSGKDPNCPTGANCSGVGIDATSSTPVVNNNAQNTTNSSQGLGSSVPTSNTPSTINQAPLSVPTSDSNSPEVQKVLSGQTDVQSLRAMLIKAGMDQNVLNKISDADLMKSYQDTLNKQ